MVRVDLEPQIGRIVIRRFVERNLMSNKLDFSKELIGRRALVSGGTRGMGAAIAQRLLDAGAKVVVTGRSRGEATPTGATFIAGDVSSVEGVKAIAAKAVDALGGLDMGRFGQSAVGALFTEAKVWEPVMAAR